VFKRVFQYSLILSQMNPFPNQIVFFGIYFNLYAPHFLYIGQAFRYSLDNAFYIFNQQIYFII